MTKGEYVKGVMRRINELGWDDSFPGAFAGSDTSKVERQVEALFRDAWRKGVGLLPRTYFSQRSFTDSVLVEDVSAGTGFVVLPADYYALSLFRMRGWKRGCFSAVEEDDAVSAIQSNEFVRGNFCRPVCTVSERPRYGRVLNYYSLPKGEAHRVEEALYVPLVERIESWEDDRELGLDERLYGPLQWLNAGVVFAVFEKGEMDKVCEEKALSF
jgi:hypothetical protein